MSRQFDIGVQQVFVASSRSLGEIDRDEIVRQTLEEGARRLEVLHGNSTYRRAFGIAAKLLRTIKP
jgi:hypothetical protein